jgi:hypothetical protein
MTDADSRGRRLDAATGIVGMAFLVVGFFLPGSPPKADDSVAQITSYFVDNRDQILAGNALIAVGVAFLVWWLGSLRGYLRLAEGGEGRLSLVAFGGGVLGLTVNVVAVAIFSGTVFKVADLGNPVLNRALFDSYNMLLAIAAVGFTVLFGAAACSGAKSGAFSPLVYWSGSLVAVAQLVSISAIFASSGFFAVGGVMGFIGFLVGLIWIVGVSVMMIRRDGVPPAVSVGP